MTSYNFDRTPDRRESESEKWNEYDEDVLPMWLADMDFRSPEPVISKLRERVEHGVFGYPGEKRGPGGGLREVIVERLEDLYNWQISPDDLVFLPGVVTAFNLACHTVAAPNGSVLVQTPVYPSINIAGKVTGVLSEFMELDRNQDGSYRTNNDSLEGSITNLTRLLILCNPHNPVGKVFSKKELENTAEICLERDVVVCSDEIHCDLIYNGYRHIPIASLSPEIAMNAITLMAPSKTFNTPGLMCSYAIIQNEKLRRRFLNARKGLVPYVNLMGTLAAETAYKEGGKWLDQLLVYLESNRDFLVDYVRDHLPGISVASPQGTYLAWLDCREMGIEGSPWQFFFENARVGLNDGREFGKGGEGFVRLNFGCARATLEEGLARMKSALKSIN